MSRLSVHVLSGGERVPMLHDERGLPLFYPTLFATSQLRNAGAAVNTIRNKLADIVVLLRWEQQQGRDLTSEFAHGDFLSIADVVSLRDFAKLDMRGHATTSRSPCSSTQRTRQRTNSLCVRTSTSLRPVPRYYSLERENSSTLSFGRRRLLIFLGSRANRCTNRRSHSRWRARIPESAIIGSSSLAKQPTLSKLALMWTAGSINGASATSLIWRQGDLRSLVLCYRCRGLSSSTKRLTTAPTVMSWTAESHVVRYT